MIIKKLTITITKMILITRISLLRASDQLMDDGPRRHAEDIRHCRRPMNDQPSGRSCRPWPSGVCLTDTRAISTRHCNRSPPSPPTRDQIKPSLTGLAQFLDLCYCFRLFGSCMAAVLTTVSPFLQ